MIIELQRLLVPEDLGGSESCAICGAALELGVVYPYAATSDDVHMGVLCEGCVEHMGRHASGRFPTIEEYRRLQAEWRTPLYASMEEWGRAEEEESG